MSLPLATLACTIDDTGISGPDVATILSSLQASAASIFGSDIYDTPDTQDGQIMAVYAQAQADSNQATIGAVAQYNPQSAIGANLDADVALGSIERQPVSFSTAPIQITGQTGTVILGGVVRDPENSFLWDLPDTVVIPDSGTVNVTVTCETPGNNTAPSGTWAIVTQVQGWQSALATAAATPGAPVETDGALRQRYTIATDLNSQTTLNSIKSTVGQVAGVQRVQVYQNDTETTDSNGLPAHSIAVVVLGGDELAIATAIEQKKDTGVTTIGTTSQVVLDPEGLPITIRFYILTLTPYYATITLKPLAGYTSAIGAQIQAALVAFINGLAIGETAYAQWTAAIANLAGTPQQQTFVITGFAQGTAPSPGSDPDITVTFNSALNTQTANIIINVVP